MSTKGSLAGKVMFISGASRGIGRAIALRAAKDGAKIIIAAKTGKNAHPKLPGTIYTVAEEVEKAGGRALPCVVDIRYEEEVKAAVERGVKEFGKLDILVNNASAINLSNTSSMTMKSYDLMNSINGRGTFLCSKVCLPFLQEAGGTSHILNISPPLSMQPRWFENHVAYTMAKFGMSMCVLGMAEEFRDRNIAVNALWPKTAIYTAAVEMLAAGNDQVNRQCRKPEIMADAAYLILSQQGRAKDLFTGNFLIDENVMRDMGGLSDMSQYACVPGTPDSDLLLDLYVDGDSNTRISFTDKYSTSTSSSSTASTGEVKETFKRAEALLTADAVKSVNATYAIILTGDEPGMWYLDLKSGSGSCGVLSDESEVSKYDVKMTMSSADFVKMFKLQIMPTNAFMSGKLKIQGNTMAAMKLEALMTKTLPKL